jgi:hypothetical protein
MLTSRKATKDFSTKGLLPMAIGGITTSIMKRWVAARNGLAV